MACPVGQETNKVNQLTFHVDALLLPKRGAQFLHLGGKPALNVLRRETLMSRLSGRESVVLGGPNLLNKRMTSPEVLGVEARSAACRGHWPPVTDLGNVRCRSFYFLLLSRPICEPWKDMFRVQLVQDRD